MEITHHYNDKVERQAWISICESDGYRMLHDDFDPDWKSGDEPHGTLTFTNKPEPAPPKPEPPRDIAAELDDLKVRITALEQAKAMEIK